MTTPKLNQPGFLTQLTTAVGFVNACADGNASVIRQQWGTVTQEIVTPEGVELAPPPLPTTSQGSSVKIDGEVINSYLTNDFVPRIHDTLMRRAKSFLELEPRAIHNQLESIEPELFGQAINAELISGTPADRLLESARQAHLSHSAQPIGRADGSKSRPYSRPSWIMIAIGWTLINQYTYSE
jgi:hypothetical protein